MVVVGRVVVVIDGKARGGVGGVCGDEAKFRLEEVEEAS